MKKTIAALILFFCLALLLAGCGAPPPGAPSVPTNLNSTGLKGEIDLTWTASTGGGLVGYNVYRSDDDGAGFNKLNSSPVATAAYQDTTVQDGVLHQYKVTAVGDAESGFSNVTVNIHGTRLLGTISGPYSAAPADSPYVVDVDQTLIVTGGNLTVPDGAKLYVLGGATIDLDFGYQFIINGLLKVLASNTNTATITAHGSRFVATGFSLMFSGADDGTTIQNATVNNLQQSTTIQISDCKPVFYNAKFSSNSSNGGAYLNIYGNAAPNIQHCLFAHLVPEIVGDHSSSTDFIMEHNIFTGGYYPLYFDNAVGPAVTSSAIRYNDFDCGGLSGQIYLSQMTGTGPVPLENNYWTGGTGSPPLPGVYIGFETTNTVDCDPPLSNSPATTVYGDGLAGPNW